jgi:hypothetical protein
MGTTASTYPHFNHPDDNFLSTVRGFAHPGQSIIFISSSVCAAKKDGEHAKALFAGSTGSTGSRKSSVELHWRSESCAEKASDYEQD